VDEGAGIVKETVVFIRSFNSVRFRIPEELFA
jgi:hypothetical protein